MPDRPSVSWHSVARPLLEGSASAVAVVLDEPLSFWGGLDPATGVIIDARHAQRGTNIAGTALVMPAGRGSSSSSSILAEAIRAGNGPRLIALCEPDEIVVLGALVAQMLDGTTVPVALLEHADYERVATGDVLTVEADGAVTVEPGDARRSS